MPSGAPSTRYLRALESARPPRGTSMTLTDDLRDRGGKKSRRTQARTWKEIA